MPYDDPTDYAIGNLGADIPAARITALSPSELAALVPSAHDRMRILSIDPDGALSRWWYGEAKDTDHAMFKATIDDRLPGPGWYIVLSDDPGLDIMGCTYTVSRAAGMARLQFVRGLYAQPPVVRPPSVVKRIELPMDE